MLEANEKPRLRLLMNRIDPGLFCDCFQSWAAALRPDAPNLVAIDGKTSRGSHDRDKGADYLVALKDNWPTLAEEVRLYFDSQPPADRHETTEGDHGRIEIRRHRVSHDVDWLASDRRFPGEPRFPDLAMIGMVEAQVERDGKVATARRYYLSSARLPARQLAHAVRAHWGVENRLHWVMDVVFHDDLMRLRTANGPANMAAMRHAAINIVNQINDKASLKVRRKTLGWSDDYLFNAITQTNQ